MYPQTYSHLGVQEVAQSTKKHPFKISVYSRLIALNKSVYLLFEAVKITHLVTDVNVGKFK